MKKPIFQDHGPLRSPPLPGDEQKDKPNIPVVSPDTKTADDQADEEGEDTSPPSPR